jgi:putative hydrolase of the HAD superfamily
MVNTHIAIRAVVFDVYGTLLEVGPPPPDADARWETVFRETLRVQPPMPRTEFVAVCTKIISEMHQTARECGIVYPEVNWSVVITRAIPELTLLPSNALERFIVQHIQTLHTTRLRPEAADVLLRLKQRGCVLGIASNAQAYTLHELQAGLATHGLTLDLFERALCFWSFEHGFSKPDPHVFRILTVRLEARGISPWQTVMVGDQLDTDIVPARAAGWHGWLLGTVSSDRGGDWPAFVSWIESGSTHE